MVNDHSDSERKTTVTTTWATVFDQQVRSECLMCTFRAFASSSVWDRKKKGEGSKGEDHLHWRVQGSTSSLTRIGSRCFEVL